MRRAQKPVAVLANAATGSSADLGYETERYGGVSVLLGPRRGAYPHANSLVVPGKGATLVVDPSLSVVGAPPPADLVLVSHAHEDHLAGVSAYRDIPVLAHQGDLAAVRSRAELVACFGLPPEETDAVDQWLQEQFLIEDRAQAEPFADGEVFELGGRSVTVVHLPGHTPGHCGFLVEPEGLFFVADIDLTSFGPYYGDIASDLDAYEESLRRCAELDVRWYATSHQKGVIEGAGEFRRRVAAFAGVIEQRDDRLLAYLHEPRTLDEIAEHRLVYRSHVTALHVAHVEKRTAAQHLRRLIATGRVDEPEAGRFQAT